VPSLAMRAPVAADIRSIFSAPDLEEAEHLLVEKFLKEYTKTAPNLVERLNEEIRRRTRVARLFPSEATYLRLVTAIVLEIAEDHGLWTSPRDERVAISSRRGPACELCGRSRTPGD
jgi:putative transposase